MLYVRHLTNQEIRKEISDVQVVPSLLPCLVATLPEPGWCKAHGRNEPGSQVQIGFTFPERHSITQAVDVILIGPITLSWQA